MLVGLNIYVRDNIDVKTFKQLAPALYLRTISYKSYFCNHGFIFSRGPPQVLKGIEPFQVVQQKK